MRAREQDRAAPAASAGAARARITVLLGVALLAGALVLALAGPARALTTIAKPRFYERPAAQPTLVAVGEELTWDAVDPTNTYVLRRKVVGRPIEYALVKSTAAQPPAIAGEEATYSVKSVLGSNWSAEVPIDYPASGELTGELPEEVPVLELSERRFFERPTIVPRLEVAGEILTWEALDPTNSYVVRRKVPGRNYEYALVKLNSALPAAFPGLTVTYSVKNALASTWAAEVGITYPSAEEPPEEKEQPPPDEATCNLYASVEGSDGNSGSLTSPLRTVKALVQDLEAGQTGCLMSGQTFTGGLTLYDGDSQGEPRKPITITSTNPAKPATIFGRVVTQSGVDWLKFTGLKFRWKEPNLLGLPQITIGSDHTSWTYNDVENSNTTICLNTIISSIWGTAHYTLIDHNRIHNCGGPLGYLTGLSNGYHSHGIYATGYHTTITNNYLYRESGRGVQLRGSHYSVVEHNIIDESGAGIVFGDLGSNDNEVAYNIITGSTSDINGCCNVFGVYSWWGLGTVGWDNTFHDNCLYGNEDGNISTGGGGFTSSSNTVANPQYVNDAERDYMLRATSPCVGYGPDTAQP